MSTNNMHQEIRDAVSKMCLKFDNKYWQNCDEKDLYPTEFVNELTISGFLASLIPEKYGGAGLPLSAGAVILEEIHKSGGNAAACHAQMYTMGTILRHGSEKQKSNFLPKIASGDLRLQAFGVTEPNSGSDTLSLKTNAVFNGEKYIINGQKIWTSLANYADYVWLATRTNDEVKKHKGISIFIVPTDDKGFKYTPIKTLGDVTTNSTFYEDVYVPKQNLVGNIDEGWNLITSQLNLERLALVNHGPVDQMFQELLLLIKDTKLSDGTNLSEVDWVKKNVANIYSGLESLKLICWKLVWGMENENLSMTDASMAKIYGSEFFIEAYRQMMEILGEIAILKKDDLSIMNSKLERMYRTASILTFGGGTNEVQRDIIAMAGLFMPRSR